MIARALSGALVAAAVVAALAFTPWLPLDEPEPLAAASLSVTPARQDLGCAGPLVLPSGAVDSGDSELSGASTGVKRSVYTAGSHDAAGAGVTSDAAVAAQVERVGGGDLSSLAALTCTAPRTDQWLVGAATSVGASARLVLTNPSRSSVEATVVAYTSLGQLDSSRVVPLAPHDQAVVLLEGVAVEASALVVHVSANGTGVVAALQDSRLDGFQPAGTDWVVSGADPAPSLIVPGVGTAGDENATVSLRLMSPSGAIAHLRLMTPEGAAVWEGVAALTLDPGVVVDVDVPAVDAGTALVEADGAVVAGALLTTTRAATTGVAGDVASEIAWVPAQDPTDETRALVTVGYSETLTVSAATAGTFALSDATGASVASVDLGSGETASIRLNVPPGTQLMATGPFAWAVVVRNGGYVTSVSPTRTTLDDLTIAVAQRRYVPVP